MLKERKPIDLGKGRVNVELLELIRTIRSHQTKKLRPKELKEALEYAGYPDYLSGAQGKRATVDRAGSEFPLATKRSTKAARANSSFMANVAATRNRRTSES
jgi:hypothetical protein